MHFPCQYLFQHFENIQTRLTSLRFDLHRYFLCKRLQINSKVDTHTNTCIHTYIHTHITFTFLTRQILPVISTGDINTSYSLPLQIQGLALQTPYTCEKTSHYRWFCTDMWNKTRYFKRMFYQNHNWQNKTFPFPHLRIPSPYARGHLSVQRSGVALRHRRIKTSTFSFINIWLVDTGRQTDIGSASCTVRLPYKVRLANNSQQCSCTSQGSQKYWQSISPCDMRLPRCCVTCLKMICSKQIETYNFRVCTRPVRKVKI